MSATEKIKKAKEIIKAADLQEVTIEDMIYCKKGDLLMVVVSYYDPKCGARRDGSLCI